VNVYPVDDRDQNVGHQATEQKESYHGDKLTSRGNLAVESEVNKWLDT